MMHPYPASHFAQNPPTPPKKNKKKKTRFAGPADIQDLDTTFMCHLKKFSAFDIWLDYDYAFPYKKEKVLYIRTHAFIQLDRSYLKFVPH